MNSQYRVIIESFLDEGLTPLEISQAIGVSFNHIAKYCEANNLEPRKFFIAKNVYKPNWHDTYWP